MKPGRANLPVIWRGNDYPPVAFTWLKVDGTPIDLTGWTPVAQSSSINFNPVITDLPHAVTQISFTAAQTALFKLGVEQWDWVWVGANGQRQGPYLFGNVEVKEPFSNA